MIIIRTHLAGLDPRRTACGRVIPFHHPRVTRVLQLVTCRHCKRSQVYRELVALLREATGGSKS